MRIATYKQGYARSASESAYPNLWKPLAGAWSPSLGPTGLTLFDQSGNNNHGTLVGMDAATDWVVGEKGYELSLDGINDQIDIGVFDKVDTGPFTVSVWMDITAAGAPDNAAVISNNTGENFKGPFLIQVSDSPTAFQALSGDQQINFTTGTGLRHFVFVRYPGAVGIEMFVDAVSKGTASGNSGILTGQNLFIGFRDRGDQWLEGTFNDAAINNREFSTSEIKQLFNISPGGIFTLRRRTFFSTAQITAAITGTATAIIDEVDVAVGGKTIIITLTGDTWVADGPTFNAERQNIINGLDSAQSEVTGWNAEVRDKEVVGAVARTSDTVVTITLSAVASYDITVQETITVTVPASALVTSSTEVVGTPTFTVDQVVVSARKGARYLILTGEPG